MKEDRIKALRLKCGIGWVWEYLSLPGKAGKCVFSPFREEKKKESFNVYRDKDGVERWFDQALRRGGDVVDFWAEAKGIGVPEAIRQMEAIVGLGFAQPPTTYKAASEGEEFAWPDNFRPPTKEECHQLRELRGLSASSFDLAGLLGTLVVGPHPRTGEVLWWITDQKKAGLEGRTFDGKPCQDSGQKCTAYPGSSKGWAYGLYTTNKHLDALDKVVLVEGGPDYFAGLEMALNSDINFRVAAMLGAGPSLGEDALQALKGRHTLILPHNDQGGKVAASRWKGQLLGSGIKVTIQLLHSDIKDLNDLVKLEPPEKIEQYLKGF
jgi:hypothetical protein